MLTETNELDDVRRLGYDAAGNVTAYEDRAGRLSKTTSTYAALPNVIAYFTHDANGQLIGVNRTGTTNDETHSYDAAGNRTNTGYSTGTAIRLLSDGAYSYEYDAEGRRTKRTETATGDRGERYVWDGEGGFGHTDDIVLVTDGQGNVLHRYLHGPATDMVFADENGMGEVLWGLGDHQRTVRDWVEYDDVAEEGVVSDHVGYDAFGNITGQSDPSRDVTVGYTGRHWDADARLYDYRARWYDPAAGRFVSEDPLGFAAGDANLQRYVGNGVGTGVDPTGLYALPPTPRHPSPPPGYKYWPEFKRNPDGTLRTVPGTDGRIPDVRWGLVVDEPPEEPTVPAGENGGGFRRTRLGRPNIRLFMPDLAPTEKTPRKPVEAPKPPRRSPPPSPEPGENPKAERTPRLELERPLILPPLQGDR